MTPAVLFGLAVISLAIAHLAATATRVLRDIAWHELEDCSRDNKSRFDTIRDEWEDVATGTETILYLAIAAHVLCLIAWASLSRVVESFNLFNTSIGVVVGTFMILATLIWFPSAIAEHAGTSFLYKSWGFWHDVIPTAETAHLGLATGRVGDASTAQCHGRRKRGRSELEEEFAPSSPKVKHEGWLDSDTRDMIEGVIELDDANVADILTPRGKMDVMSVSLSWDEVLDDVTEVGWSLSPSTGQPNEFLGILLM